MRCPYCHADNAEDSLRCSRCGADFRGVDDSAETIGGDSTAPSAAPSPRRPATGAGVVSPPPGAGASPAGGSWPSYGGATFALEPGADFGPRYRIESLIGEGGMGTVYKAFDKDVGRVVALKLLRSELTANAEAMQRFKQELLLASKISHKNILRIHDLGDANGVKFISMAYVEGEDLHDILKKQHRLPVERAVPIAKQLCSALEAAHAEGVVHRDLKPQNVLVDAAGQIYVSDFGLAKSLEAGAAGMTRTGEFLGTPRYMAPEQVEGKPVDQRTDLYALGLIFYEMVTGDVPFTGTSTLQVMYQRVKERPKNPKLLNPEVPDYFARIVMRCLEKDAAQRYQSAREILHDLETQRPASRSFSVQISLPMPARRGWLLAAGGVVLLLALAFALPPVRNFVLRRAGPTPSAPSGIPSLAEGKYLAVLPFRVLGEQSSLGYVAEGLVEALSAKLFQLRDVRLASPAAVTEAAKKDSLEKIARGLGVNLIVQGTVQGAGEKVRIIVNLQDIAAGRRLWSQEFSGVTQDLFTLEDQIYTGLVSALELNLSGEELARGTAHPTGSIEAYDLYLRGRTALRGQQKIENVETAIRLFQEALQKDPSFALAYAGLADAGLVMYRENKEPLWAERALGAARQAQRLNDNLAEVHFSLGSVYHATGKSSEAIVELRRAMELAPNSDEGYRRLGTVYLSSGRKEEAIQAYLKAVEVNPYYWTNHNALGGAYLQVGETDKALEAYRRVIQLEPENFFGHANIGSVYFRQGKYAEGIPAFQKALELQPHFGLYSNLGTAHFFLKNYAEAVKMFEKAVEMNPNVEVTMGNLADAYRSSRQWEKALATYDKAITLAFKELQVNPRSAGTMGSLALYYAKKGDANQARDFIRRARSIDRASVPLIYIEAVVHALGGRAPEALRSLREAFQKGYSTAEASNDPELQTLHTHPEFLKLVKDFSGKSN